MVRRRRRRWRRRWRREKLHEETISTGYLKLPIKKQKKSFFPKSQAIHARESRSYVVKDNDKVIGPFMTLTLKPFARPRKPSVSTRCFSTLSMLNRLLDAGDAICMRRRTMSSG
jgi:hypothetical protein